MSLWNVWSLLVPKESEASLGTFYFFTNCKWVGEQLVTVMCEQLVTVMCEQGVTVIIYHHCIWYGRWRANFGGSGHAFECNGLLLFLMMLSLHHYCIRYGRWRANFGCSGDAFGGNGFLLFLMVFLYIGMVRSSYIIIVSGMGDDVPILGAAVVLFEAMVSA